MKWTTATALFLALSASGLGVAVVLNREPKSPAEVLAEVKGEMGRVSFDKSDGLRRLERALDDPRATADPVLATELYRTRAGLFRDLGAYDLARTDLETLLTTYRRGDRDLELEILRLQARDGQVVTALQRARSLLQREPDFSDGWALRGELEASAADKKLEQASLVVDRSLAQVDARAAKEVLVKLTARDVEDPGRDFLVKQLRDLFSSASGTDLNEVLRLVNEPRSGYKRARAAFARAMTSSMAASTVIALANSFERAGRDDLGIQLHTASRALESIRTDPDAVSAYLTDLARSNRIIEARRVVGSWDWRLGGTRDFYRSAGDVLYKAKEYSGLGRVAAGLSRLGGDSGRVWSWFYSSIHPIANSELIKKRAEGDFEKLAKREKQLRQSIDYLKRFIDDTQEVEPFFGAKEDALFWIADAYEALGDTPREQVFLRRALNAKPNYSAEAWKRLAETLRESKQGVPWEDVEDALTMAMQLAPEQTSSLAPLWYEAGERALAKRGLSVEQVIDEVARARRTVPNRPVGPSVMTQLAASHLENGRGYAAIRAAKEARAKHRNLVPPLDIIISAELREPNLYSPERNIIRRIEAAGIDKTVEGFMAQLPTGRLEGEALVRAIRAAPVRFGKAAVARNFFDLNEPERAVDALAGIDDESTPEQLRVLRAQLLIQSGEWDLAITELRRAEADPLLTGQSLLLQIEALIGANQLRALNPVVDRLEAALPTTSRMLLDAVDSLSAAGRSDLAKQILDRLDQDMKARTPAFYRRRVLVDVLTSSGTNPSEAQESILRAEAYLEDGTPEIGALLLAVKGRDWTDLPELISRLSESEFKPNAYEEAALALLGERLESGQRTIRAGLARSPRNPHWGFLSTVAKALSDDQVELPDWFGPDAAADAELLHGNGQRKPKDPRDALVLYLVSNDRNWSPWVLPGLRALEASTQSKIWARWLRILVLDVRGEARAQDALLQKLTRSNPRFGPGHDLAVTAAEKRNPTEPLHPELVRARRVRLASLGEDLVADPIEIGLARAGELARQGNYIEATRALKPVVQAGGPRQTEGMLMLGILMIRADQPSLAAQYLYEAARKGPGVFRDVVVDSLLFSIRHAIETSIEGAPQRGALTKNDALNMLDGLARRYPLDPMVALARLEFLELGEGERGSRAAGILQRLFKDSGGKTLDQLRRGSSRRWVEFLAPIASDVAQDLIDRDLEAQPGNLELWQLGGYVAESRGETAEAREFYKTLMAIDPRARTGYALAAILIDEGTPIFEVYDVILKADRAQGGGSSRATFLAAMAELRIRSPNFERIIGRLEGLWLSRERTQREVDPIQLGLLYADALTQRGEPGDMAKLGQLLTVLREMAVGSLYEADMVEALDGLRSAVVEANAAASKAAQAGTGDAETAKAQ